MIVKLKPKRRCRIPRRPHPDLDYFFGRLEHAACEMADVSGPDLDLDDPAQPRH
jgi:hypothetical protein